MPSRNSVKEYRDNCVYHIYNRGVNRDQIFTNESDFLVFESLLARFLLPKAFGDKAKNYSDRIELICYCLMPNHFHLMVKQKDVKAMSEFMESLTKSYVHRFNKQENRVGHLFQDRYKARLLQSEFDMINTSKYIHRNPLDVCSEIHLYPHSTLKYLAQDQIPKYLSTESLMNYFGFDSRRHLEYVQSEDLILL